MKSLFQHRASGGGANLSSFSIDNTCKNKKLFYNSYIRYHNYNVFLMKKQGFTLSEVLSTLGIIGVVAAMTMPSLIANYQKKVWVNQLKKSVSVIEQGFQKMLADDGVDNLEDTSVWANIDDDSAGGGSGDCLTIYYGTDPSCTVFFDEMKKYFKIIDISATDGYINRSPNDKSKFDDLSEDKHLKFADGMWVVLNYIPNSNNMGDLWIDINGDKLPNTYGRDVFGFNFTNNGKLIPSGDADDCTTSTYGDGCTARVIENGWVMDY